MCRGWKAFIVKEKLKVLKDRIKAWNKESFGCLDTKLGCLSIAIQELDIIGENSMLSLDQLSSLKKLTADSWETANMKDNLLRQKSRCKWLKDGDANTSYFHACINNKRRRNQIRGIWINEVWYEDDLAMRREITNYFKNLFSIRYLLKLKLEGVQFSTLNDNQRSSLDVAFSDEEIRLAVWSCVGDKSLGPDGFNFRFFQEFWEVVKKDIILFIKEFHVNDKLLKGLNSSFIALIPKINCPNKIQDYMPIFLVGSLYNFLAKILSSRLKGVMGSLISPS
ncbi:PREDICTED: uncharacterized protein LOC109341648 [Lupinus angustifolius]|uniref:uncharacterized protein LOC109341648 n=1 Tax=Lupinus angustifolius TaxID=3871 RepID=UPI00092E85F3|nr:PREDICTED: uncharacterized protein LOC109341648 [Lupinus angustifolius]